MAILLDKDSKIVVQGITGREASMITKYTLEYGTAIAAGVTPGKGGTDVHGVPVFDTVAAACKELEINTSVVYVPPAFVYDAVMEAIGSGIKFVFIATENIPQQDAIKFLTYAERKGVRIIGPNSVGIISPGARMKLGAIGGDNVERCFVPGHVGVISRSGGMTAETAWMVKKAGFGISTSISIGGDPFIGSTPVDLLELFEKDNDTHAVVTFSEPGTRFEEDMADFVAQGKFSKPLVSFVAGRFTEAMPEGTVFGHAGAMISGGAGKPSQKMSRLAAAGAYVADQYDDLITLLQKALG